MTFLRTLPVGRIHRYRLRSKRRIQRPHLCNGQRRTAQTGSFTVVSMQTLLTDSLGNVSVFQTGASGGVQQVFSAVGSGCSTCTYRNNVFKTYDSGGNLLTSTDAAGNVTTYTYDSNNNMTSMTSRSTLQTRRLPPIRTTALVSPSP